MKQCVFNKKDYNSGDGMLTSVWGPNLWHVLHTMSFNYPVNPTEQDKIHYMNFITTPITTKYEKIEINQTLYLNTKNMDPNLECPPLKRSLGLHKFLIAKKLIISELGSYLFRDVDVPSELFTWVSTLSCKSGKCIKEQKAESYSFQFHDKKLNC